LGKNRKQGRKKKWITKLFRNSRNNPKKRWKRENEKENM
jgi:hypothetical protein